MMLNEKNYKQLNITQHIMNAILPFQINSSRKKKQRYI